MRSATTYQKGVRAERLAAWLLRLKGYKILAMRYKTRFGEVDIIARRGAVLACVEVKYRPDRLSALDAVPPRAQARIQAAAEHYISTHNIPSHITARFDIIAVYSAFRLRHFPQAWYI